MKIDPPGGNLARWFRNPGRLSVQRAIGELRAGRPVILSSENENLTVVAAEMLGGPRITEWHAATGGTSGLILPSPRLAHLGVIASAPAYVSLDGFSGQEVDALLMAVNPTLRSVLHRPAQALEKTALELVKRAYLLPAAFIQQASNEQHLPIVKVDARAVENFHDESARELVIAARTHVPLNEVVDAEFVVFRGGDGLHDQVAIVVGRPDTTKPVLTRLHSACLTGDLFASLKCDCGDQLRTAVSEIAATGGGVLLYLDQEGRGIGLLNKMRAYGLQELGHDTLDADAVLGYGPDERRYAVAGAMLNLLGVQNIILMTNNPDKITALENFGVNVVGHRRLMGNVNPHNEDYLSTKAHRAGHLLGNLGLQFARK